ncbi:Gfo/Idh/MocA family protein [Reichenbachiella ulvae]|uniref:Gfo/Idh/MocA family oxidoreductase n=1 Tax=Reichenbachiella ulvae TaxID=2980104 RepID=A0ABT3CSJ0_9BACT|nr:Gfo/Idh/MocA family oxidoreductase [Reichenbachiella ulvae]MCV9386680.1 Gfo/Idh/MocA family oxidoreductase [Reichenbachiella ulvae]
MDDIRRREFIKKAALGSTGLMLSASGLSAKSYRRILGSNDRIGVAIAGLGRRVQAFYPAFYDKKNNLDLIYLCDVMEHQCSRAAGKVAENLDYKPKLAVDIRKVLANKKVDALINATPDHWHTPGTVMALKEGKHVYVEKPCSHNMEENELIVAAQKKYDKVVQMGNQQRSSPISIEIIKDIQNGAIGNPYKAIAFFNNKRGAVPHQMAAPVPEGLNWELFQGPAVRRDYTSETWNYNWHWYGWNYGTAELGNNGTHELDIARWALGVDLPEEVQVDAAKTAFVDDGWEMYDTMEATYRFPGDKVIKWDGKSRNGYKPYGAGRGTIIYGSEGSVFVDRGKYILHDRSGKVIKESASKSNEEGMALGGGGDTSTAHVMNFFNAIRGKEKLQAPIDDASISMAMVHYGNVAYRIKKGFKVDPETGKMLDNDAMKLWGREYAEGWKPAI